MILEVVELTGDPTLTFSTVSVSGDQLWAHVYAGTCRIDVPPPGGLRARLSPSFPSLRMGFYVPDADPFRPAYQLSAWGEVTLANAQIRTSEGASQRGPYGVDAVSVQLVEDSEGRGGQWPYLSFDALGGRPMVVRYRVTVLEPSV